MSQKKLSSFLESMGISTEDVWTLFMIMDNDQTGLVNLEEFVSGEDGDGMGGWDASDAPPAGKPLQIMTVLQAFFKTDIAEHEA